MKKILFISAFAWLFAGCEKSEIMEFTSNDAAVYFRQSAGYSSPADGSVIYETTYNYTDSVVVSFVGQKNTVKNFTFSVPISTMGKVKDYKRPVKIVIDEKRTTAVRGVDFEVNLDTVYVQANAGKAYLKVSLLRTDALLSGSKRVAFELQGNEHFKLHIQNYKSSTNWASTAKNLNALKFAVIFNEQYTEPNFYMWFGEDYFGPWQAKKYQVINEVMEWTHKDWVDSGKKVTYGRLDFAARKVRDYLQAMADGNTPVPDSDGSYVQLAAKYAVDYSKYEK